jgi:hypothetical protein
MKQVVILKLQIFCFSCTYLKVVRKVKRGQKGGTKTKELKKKSKVRTLFTTLNNFLRTRMSKFSRQSMPSKHYKYLNNFQLLKSIIHYLL